MSGAFKARDPMWNAVREEDVSDDEDNVEDGMPLDKPSTPPLLPPDLMKEWAERQKKESDEKPEDNTNSDDEYVPVTAAEVAAELEPATEASAEPETSEKDRPGVPPGRKKN